MTLFSARNHVNTEAVKMFARELKNMGFTVRRVRAEQSPATCLSEAYGEKFSKHLSMYLMQADGATEITKASGFCRPMEKSDLL